MTTASITDMDENTRRYYLEAMGVQCWQLLESPQLESPAIKPDENDTAVIPDEQGINSAILHCTKCELHKTRKQPLAGRGKPSAELMFVLLSPDTRDDDNAHLCSGEANDLFSKMLSAIDIVIDDVYITSLLKCKVPQAHTISPAEIQSCKHYLLQQIQFVKPALLIVLGETAVRCLLQQDVSLDDCRLKNTAHSEKTQLQFFSVPLFATYSPQELLLKPENKAKAWSDLQQLQKLIKQH